MHAHPKKPRPLAVPMTRRTLIHAATGKSHAPVEPAECGDARARLAARAHRPLPPENGMLPR